MEMVALFVPIFSSAFLFGMIAFVVWTNARSKVQRAAYQAQVQTKLVERFNSAPELVEFLKSPEGRQFVGDIEIGPRIMAGERILGGIRKGIVAGLLGAGFLAIAIAGDDWAQYPGWILLTLGAGYAIATFVSVKLSRSWGLLPEKHATDETLLP